MKRTPRNNDARLSSGCHAVDRLLTDEQFGALPASMKGLLAGQAAA